MEQGRQSILRAQGITVAVDLAVGHLSHMEVRAGGRMLVPLHRAPWAETPDAWPQGIAPGLAHLSGDFFCAPFSASDIDGAPTHGWPANSAWSIVGQTRRSGVTTGVYRLDRTVMGARIEKVLRLVDGHPFLYQEHRLTGGRGLLPVAHHTMVRMAAGGRLAFSPKRRLLAPLAAAEPGSVIAYPSWSDDIAAMPLAAGGVADLRVFPLAERHEDFAMLVEGRHEGPGWTALTRQEEQDVVLVLKDPRQLPVTMLWYSHGGRGHAPWNGRHRGVLGIEDGRTAVGHSRSMAENELTPLGVPTAIALEPGRSTSIRQVIGAAVLPRAGMSAEGIELAANALRLRFSDGTSVALAHAGGFVTGGA